MEKKPIVVSAAVFQGLEAVRQSGYTNMLDRPRVIELAVMLGYADAADWIRENRNLYAAAIFGGFVADEKGE